MSRNLGQSSLRRKRRSGNSIAAFDCLPTPLRQLLSEAALRRSPASARSIWSKLQAKGLTPDETLIPLSQAKAKTLARDRKSTVFIANAQT
ncbi:DUF6525 family protein [Ruegeria hyattellae]|uniref:DUF6525 family protein n=1 Tax=Ruegeria hyattellae TaxID=3233337 RepID=UPI00355C4597